MIRQCAWCGCWLGETPPLHDQSVTHGLCLPCCKELMLVWKDSVEAVDANSLLLDDAEQSFGQ